MDNLHLRVPSTIVFGHDVLPQLGPIAREYGGRALIVTEGVLHDGNHITRVNEILKRSSIETMVYDELMPTSRTSVIDELGSLARASKTQVVVGLGGMRVLSIARCVANVAASRLSIGDILEGKVAAESLAYIEVPSSYRNHFLMRPESVIRDHLAGRARIVHTAPHTVRAAVIDTSFTQTLSGKYALAAILDTLLAAIEGFFSTSSSLYSTTLLERGIRELHGAAQLGIRNPQDGRFRVRAAEAGLLIALGLGVTGQGMGGLLSYAINAKFSLPKSWVAAILLPHVVEMLIPRDVERAAQVAALLGEPVQGIMASEDAPRAARAIRKLLSQLDLPTRLRDLDVTLDQLSVVADESGDSVLLETVPGGAGVAELQQLIGMAY